MVEYGGVAVRCVPLSPAANGICLAIGAFSLIWSVIIKLVLPPNCFNRLVMDQSEITEEEEKTGWVNVLKKSYG